MNILILGSGGREHALAWKLSQSKKVQRIFIAPGNAGTLAHGTNLEIEPTDFRAVRDAVIEHDIRMVIVGPEAPLVAGISDFFLSDRSVSNVPVIGPDARAAMLEGSKDFAKAFLTRHNIPTAAYRSFDSSTADKAWDFLKSLKPPYVIKADGLAAGKGVVILDDIKDAFAELKSMLGGKFGNAGSRVVIEQFLRGIEMSAFIITDGHSYKLLPSAKDYKRAGTGDTGLNTGGMGAVSPVPFAGKEFMDKVVTRIIDPTVKGLASDGIKYKGFIFFGLINVEGDPFVIEYNARLGDPESEVIIPRIKSDFFDLLEGVAQGNLADREIETDERFVTTVMLASGGYPGSYEKGKAISGLEASANAIIFHAGTTSSGSMTLTAGGRVLACTGTGESMEDALASSYCAANTITFESKYFRSDIGMDVYPKS